MRFFSLIFFISFSSILYSQNEIKLSINHKVGSYDLEFLSEFEIPNGDFVELDRCEYYISEISITHDGGSITEMNDVWILVDAFDPTVYDLGTSDITEVEAITFSVGVETPENNADPALWPSSHPLAPQNPSMHWGWAAGYRFLAMEGNSGTAGADYTFEVHALGNVNYHSQTVDVSAFADAGEINLAIDANYLEAFTDVTTASGGITHGESGDAVFILNNFRDDVFSAGQFVGVDEVLVDDVSFQIAPNPSIGGEDSKLILDLDLSSEYELEIIDLSGKLIFNDVVSGSDDSFNLPSVETGIYMINMKRHGSVERTQRWVVK